MIMEKLFSTGDVVEGFPHYSKEKELGVVLESSHNKNRAVPYAYSVNWQNAGHQAWFEQDKLQLIQKCAIQVRRDYI